MRDQIFFNFSQARLIQYGITLQDALVLQYVWEFQNSDHPRIQRWFPPGPENFDEYGNFNPDHRIGHGFVWVAKAKIKDDLPILNIQDRQFRRITEKLVRNGLMERHVDKGSCRSFLHVPEEVMTELQYKAKEKGAPRS